MSAFSRKSWLPMPVRIRANIWPSATPFRGGFEPTSGISGRERTTAHRSPSPASQVRKLCLDNHRVFCCSVIDALANRPSQTMVVRLRFSNTSDCVPVKAPRATQPTVRRVGRFQRLDPPRVAGDAQRARRPWCRLAGAAAISYFGDSSARSDEGVCTSDSCCAASAANRRTRGSC